MSKDVINDKKTGGPYTKKEQEQRSLQVFNLHFENKLSTIKIAELLSVHRNTIHDDISFWNAQILNEFKPQDLTHKIIKQIHRMELQRERLYEYFEVAKSLAEELSIERFISDIDIRLE